MNDRQRKIIKWVSIVLILIIAIVVAFVWVQRERTLNVNNSGGTSVSDQQSSTLSDDEKAKLENDKRMGAHSAIGLSDARSVAITWAQRWARGYDYSVQNKPVKEWLDTVAPLSSPALVTRMGDIDTSNIPQTGAVVGAKERVNRGNAVNFTVSYESGVALTVVVEKQGDSADAKWLVISYGLASDN